MLHSRSLNSKILLTTPDYPPKLGGLSTFTKNIENSLKNIGLEYDLLVWDPLQPLKARRELTHSYRWGLHIHYQGGVVVSSQCSHNINFLHGSEILFTSPNILKRIVKALLKPRAINYLSRSHLNICISEFTLNKVQQRGLKLDYGRDLVFQNCIELKKSSFVKKDFDTDTLSFICVARDVPHKNMNLAFELVKSYALNFERKIKFFCTKSFEDSGLVECIDISGSDSSYLDELYSKCHFNLLLSRDDSRIGFYEGFGLTVLEAGCWGTPSIVADSGGLPEAVHHLETGWVYKLGSDFSQLFNLMNQSDYQEISRKVFEHTHRSHGCAHYETLLSRLLL